jgi:hypothetical protein
MRPDFFNETVIQIVIMHHKRQIEKWAQNFRDKLGKHTPVTLSKNSAVAHT